jgi:hypothetical protein
MATINPALLGKIVNPNFAFAALHTSEPHGEFKALVHLAQPEKHPSNMKIMEIYSADLLNVRIRCDQIEHVIGDRNVLRVELREYVSKGGQDT